MELLLVLEQAYSEKTSLVLDLVDQACGLSPAQDPASSHDTGGGEKHHHDGCWFWCRGCAPATFLTAAVTRPMSSFSPGSATPLPPPAPLSR